MAKAYQNLCPIVLLDTVVFFNVWACCVFKKSPSTLLPCLPRVSYCIASFKAFAPEELSGNCQNEMQTREDICKMCHLPRDRKALQLDKAEQVKTDLKLQQELQPRREQADLESRPPLQLGF